MEAVFPLSAFLGCFWLTTRSLGHGLGLLLGYGYLNGVIRANFLSVATTFMFDAAVAGVYVGMLLTRWPDVRRVLDTRVGLFTLLLMGWPLVLSFVPVNHLLVQFVALRATVWFLPVLLIAVLLGPAELDKLARWVVGLNVVAGGFGLVTFVYGIEVLYPQNAVTVLMYRSADVAGGHHRVPACFLTAHQYGNTMLLSLPLVLDLLVRPTGRTLDRALAVVGGAAAVGGVFMCAAKQPVATGVLVVGLYWLLTGLSARAGIGLGLLAAIGVYLVAANERFQRVTELGDLETVTVRVQGSANDEFFALLGDYPFGAGMGSSVGTSVPYFLADVAPTPIGLENEYSRILVDQGWIGLVGWVGFVGWLLAVPPVFAGGRPWADGRKLMYALCLATWGTAYLGTGTLAGIPGAVMLLVFMGVLARPRAVAGGRA